LGGGGKTRLCLKAGLQTKPAQLLLVAVSWGRTRFSWSFSLWRFQLNQDHIHVGGRWILGQMPPGRSECDLARLHFPFFAFTVGISKLHSAIALKDGDRV